ncbi:IS200/IS605 family element RNA-guided endonuclease TnpB [uncultured Parvimonas sp.]|uniref:IS200/IS605 family element RNA-guided endonuclease TnpB n=1 Tax=uncultured Parvimonas sp. TaxID=747372 RepID=UPI0025913880|nr:IS200/IS605 family element RNA-guided endonuclease TnpB [uncultured Parvimonas sp.]
MQLKAYKYRIYPTEEQKIFINKTFGCVRLVYNLMLNDRIKAYKESESNPDKKLKYPTPAKYKKEYEFLKEVDSLALANAQMNLDKAYKNFFRDKTICFPRFKSKKNPVQSYTTNNQNGTVNIVGKYIKIPKLKSLIKIKIHREIKGIIKSATISRVASGKYYVSILCETEINELPKTNSNIGIDLGLKDMMILSNGEKVGNKKFSRKLERKLRREQRKLSRKQEVAKKEKRDLKECKNYQKQKIKLVKIHEKIMNSRNDFLNKLSTEIIKNHDIICIEDLNTKGLLQNHKLARSIADVSWYKLINKLEYKAKWYGKEIIKIDRWYPSSQICSVCGENTGKKALSIREWTCPFCNTTHDRDINAAKNILAEGLRIRQTA